MNLELLEEENKSLEALFSTIDKKEAINSYGFKFPLGEKYVKNAEYCRSAVINDYEICHLHMPPDPNKKNYIKPIDIDFYSIRLKNTKIPEFSIGKKYTLQQWITLAFLCLPIIPLSIIGFILFIIFLGFPLGRIILVILACGLIYAIYLLRNNKTIMWFVPRSTGYDKFNKKFSISFPGNARELRNFFNSKFCNRLFELDESFLNYMSCDNCLIFRYNEEGHDFSWKINNLIQYAKIYDGDEI